MKHDKPSNAMRGAVAQAIKAQCEARLGITGTRPIKDDDYAALADAAIHAVRQFGQLNGSPALHRNGQTKEQPCQGTARCTDTVDMFSGCPDSRRQPAEPITAQASLPLLLEQ